MQRLLSLKLASKLLKNQPSTTPSLHSSITSKTTVPPLFSKPNPNHIHGYSATNPQNFTTVSRSWRSEKNVYEKIRGVLSNPVLVRETLSKGTVKGLLESRVGYLKGEFSRRTSDLSPSFDGHRRTLKSWLRRQSSDSVVLGLIVTNVAVFMLWRVANRQFMLNNFTISVDNFKSGRLHTLITSAFSQIDTGHLMSNMIGLYFFGTSIGRTFGPEFVLKLYLAGAMAGSIFYLAYHAFLAPSFQESGPWGIDSSRIPGLGASGAVNAIMLLNIFLFPKATLYLDFIIPVPAILLGIFLVGKDVLRIIEGDSQISGSAHLGGAAVAAITWLRIRKGRLLR